MRSILLKALAAALSAGISLRGSVHSFSLSLKPYQTVSAQNITTLPPTFFITGIVVEFFGYSIQEIEYLFGLNTPALCTKEQFLKGIERLRTQCTTAEITFSMIKKSTGYELHIKGVYDWAIGRIKYSGMNFAAEEYGNLYDGTSGELFSMERHKGSLALMEKTSQEKGYLDTAVNDQFVYHDQQKLVDIYISILPKSLYKITDIRLNFVQALHSFPPDDRTQLYKKFFSHFIGKGYDTKEIANCLKDLKRYLSEQGCVSIVLRLDDQIDKEKNTVSLLVTIGCSEQRVLKFFGNHFFSVDQLRGIIMRFGNEAGILPPSVMCQEIQEAYVKKGFWQVDVSTHQDEDSDFFIIKEGPRIRVAEVTVKGAQLLEQKKLIAKFFKKTIKGKYADDAALADAIDALIAWYKSEGFMDVAVLKKEWLRSHKDDAYNLHFIIDEGPHYTVAAVQVDNIPEDVRDAVHSLLPSCPRSFSLEEWGFLKKKIIHLLREKGYGQATVTSDMVLVGTAYTVIIKVDAGALVHVGKIMVKGAFKTKHPVIRSLVDAKPGQPWVKEKLQVSFGHLKATDVFERIAIQPMYEPGSCERDILVTVHEDDPFELRVRLGYEQLSKNFAFKKGSSYTAGGTFLWKNPTGQADKVIFDVDMSRFERKVVLGYNTPFLISFPLMTTVKGYSNRYTQPVAIGSIHPLYNITQEGFLCGLSKHFSCGDIGMTIGVEWMMMNDISDRISRAINFKTTLIGQHVPYFFAEPMVYLDFLDNRLTPRKGSFAAFTFKGMFPLATDASYFVKALVENGWFVPLAELIWATRIRVGHIFKQEFNAVMPPERFYLGGPNSLRSYQVDKCPPLGAFIDDNDQIQWIQQGGKTMLNLNTELRFPLFYKPLQGVVFQDFGILVERPQDLVAFPSRTLGATGFGLRYATPIGPFRFDIGWKLRRQSPEEPAYAWFLTFDHMF